MRFFTADLHLYHARVIEYCSRPFEHVFGMHVGLARRWNEVVGPDDEVWVLGDVHWSKWWCVKFDPGLVRESMEWFNGTKCLVLGNHDKWQSKARWLKSGFDKVVDWAYVPLALDVSEVYGGRDMVLLSHYPYRDALARSGRRVSKRAPEDNGRTWLLHGHQHGRFGKVSGTRQIDVGVDAWDYRPVSEREIVEIIMERDWHKF